MKPTQAVHDDYITSMGKVNLPRCCISNSPVVPVVHSFILRSLNMSGTKVFIWQEDAHPRFAAHQLDQSPESTQIQTT